MLKKISYIVFLITSLFVLYACKSNDVVNDDYESKNGELIKTVDSAGNKVEIGAYATHNANDVDASFLGYGINLANYSQVSARNTNITFPVFARDKISQQQVIKVYETVTDIKNIEGKTMEEYIQSLQVKAKVKLGAPFGKLDIAASFSTQTTNSKEQMYKTIDIQEQSYYLGLQVNPNDYADMLSESFVNDAKNLPIEQFIRRYGSHVLTSVTMGGAMKLDYTIASFDDTNVNNVSVAVDASVRGWIKTNVDIDVDYRESIKNKNVNVSVNLSVIGGETVGIYSEQDISKKYAEWQKSIKDKPSLMGIKDDNSLYPIWDIVAGINSNGDSDNAIYQKRASEIQAYFLKVGQDNYQSILSQYSEKKIVFPSGIKKVTIEPEGNTDIAKIQDITYKTGVLNSNTRYKVNLEYENEVTGHHSITYIPIKESENVKVSSNGILEATLPDNIDSANVEVLINAGGISRTVKLYIEKVFRVDYVSNGGNDLNSIDGIQKYSTIYEPIEPYKENYQFVGWYTDQALTQRYDFDEKIVSDLVLYAKWNRLLTVTYVIEGDRTDIKNGYISGETKVIDDFIPRKVGYYFKGWYMERELKTQYTFDETISKDLVLYAKWEKLLTVTFYDGETLIESRDGFRKGIDLVVDAPVVSKDEYIFEGWYTDLNLITKYEFNSALTNDTNIYAKWKKKPTYIVTFDLGIEGKNRLAENLKDGDKIYINEYVTNDDLNRNGYKFIGWYFIANGEERKYTGNEFVVNSDFTFTAKWLPKQIYTLTFKFMTDKNDFVDTGNEESSKFDLNQHSVLASPKKHGYIFDGWYTMNEDGIERKLIGTVFEVNGNMTFTAKWIMGQVTITYEGLKEGDSNTNPGSVSIINPLELKKAERKGYTFDGWYEEITLENYQLVEEINLNDRDPEIEEIILQARWTKTKYTITYHNVDSNSENNPTTFYFDDKPKSLHDATRPGYTFVGWYRNVDSTVKVTEIKGFSSNLVLYAKWEKITYTITYKNIDTNNPNNPNEYQITSDIDLYEPTKQGNTFVGWYLSKNGNDKIIKIKNMTGNIDLYAKWEVKKYNISYFNVENAVNDNADTLEHGSLLKLKSPIKEHYNFIGWYLDSELTINFEPNIHYDKDINLYAKWEVKKYNISYFNVEDAVNDNADTLEHGSLLKLKSPIKEHYNFIGWYLDSELTINFEPNIYYDKDINLYAKWSIKVYTITYTYNVDVDASNPNKESANANSQVNLFGPMMFGPEYKFLGWYLNGVQVSRFVIISDVTIEGRFEKIFW
ncbi:InlB B-repeat-containing protein [Haploplasma axanthum]|uniref:Internalin-A n=1 Tax=Haploplasma axanthum TaxID=29552 RepID=A0A449BDE9_HAPAX|nr:InlB B-repeat-containing protein [Haploplasma axanthum]VEU80330.1 Internalin-A precursor [Haploplasma axanthum]